MTSEIDAQDVSKDVSAKETIGFIGLGILGRSMAARLLNAGQDVVAFNRTHRDEHRFLIDLGIRWVESPSVVASLSSVVFVCVTDSEAAQSVALGESGYVSCLGAQNPCKVVCEISTISPVASKTICDAVSRMGCSYLDTPFSGSHISVEQYKGAFMVGGDFAAFVRVHPILTHIAPRATHVGVSGRALSMKIAVNLNLSAQMIAFGESVLLAERSGIPKDVAIEVLCNCAISSPMIQYRGPLVAREQSESFFNLTMMRKDLRLALELGDQLGVSLPLTALGEQLHTSGIDMGFAESDFGPGMYKVLAAMSKKSEGSVAPDA